jgi:glycosyltransferase involved in cell wall biosynthesis
MHVIYIHQHFATKQGATGTRSYEMSRRLLQAGHRVTMICGEYAPGGLRPKPDQRITEHDIDGIRVLQIAEPYANQMGPLRRMLAFGRFARSATQIIRGLRADLVFATSTPLTVGIPGMKGSRHLGVPFVFEVRDVWPEVLVSAGVLTIPLMIWSAQRLERKIYRAADHFIALAPGMKDSIVRRTGYPAEAITLVPNASDLDLFRPDDRPLADARFGPPDAVRAVFTGAHGLVNGLDAVLDAAVELKRMGEQGIQFVFIGSGSQRERLMERSRREGIDHMCSWVAAVPKHELAEILPRMGVGLMILKNAPALHYGSSPNKFFDYIAAGLPVLNNYPGWLADMIGEHRCGLAVSPDDPAAFAGALVWFRNHPQERREMGRQARRLAETQFSRELLGEQFVRTLETVHARGRSASRLG